MSEAPANSAEESAVPSTKPSKPGKASVFTVLLVIFIDLLGFGMVLPMLPYLTKYCDAPMWAVNAFDWLGMPQAGTEGFGTYAVLIALMTFSFSLAQFVVAPIWGRLSDRVGRKPVLSLSLTGYIGSWVLFYLAFAEFQSIDLLIVSRLLAGLFAANISTAQAYMADVYPPEKRSKAMGLVGAAFGLGFTLGPALGAGAIALSGYFGANDLTSLSMPIVAALVLTTIALCLCVFKLPESLPKELRGAVQRQRGRRLARLIAAARKPVIGSLLVSFFTVTFGFVVLETFYSPFNSFVLEFPPETNGVLFSIVGVVIVIVQGGMISRLTKKFGPWKLLFTGLVMQGVSLVMFGFMWELWQVVLVTIGLAFGNSLTNPSILGLISQNAEATDQGGTMGLTQSSSAFGRLLGPIMAGMVWGYAGPQWTFVAGGGLILLTIPLAFVAYKRRPAA